MLKTSRVSVYFNSHNFLFRQYDVSDTRNPKLTGQVWLGGSITKEFGAKVVEDPELTDQPQARYIQGMFYI